MAVRSPALPMISFASTSEATDATGILDGTAPSGTHGRTPRAVTLREDDTRAVPG